LHPPQEQYLDAVDEALAALSVLIAESSAVLSGQNLANSLYSMHDMSIEAEGEVYLLIH
jgi:hypothetical protein